MHLGTETDIQFHVTCIQTLFSTNFTIHTHTENVILHKMKHKARGIYFQGTLWLLLTISKKNYLLFCQTEKQKIFLSNFQYINITFVWTYVGDLHGVSFNIPLFPSLRNIRLKLYIFSHFSLTYRLVQILPISHNYHIHHHCYNCYCCYCC